MQVRVTYISVFPEILKTGSQLNTGEQLRFPTHPKDSLPLDFSPAVCYNGSGEVFHGGGIH